MVRLMCLSIGMTVLALWLAMPGVAAGAPILAVNFDDTGTANGSGPDVSIGWGFSTTGPISVSQLGFWDQSANGLNESHAVGIWNAAGAGTAADALVTTTLSAGTVDSLAAGTSFRMKNVTPIILPAGSYVIGAYLPGTQVEPFKDPPSAVDNFAAATGITYLGRRLPVAGFNRPDGTATGLGMFGPNFTFEAVPEPSSVALAAFGLIGLAARRTQRPKPRPIAGK